MDSGRDFPLCANDEMRAGFSSGTDVASRYTFREALFSDAEDFQRIQVRCRGSRHKAESE